ncbi:MAG: molybdate ABC transporter permease subunit [Deltaproteobacteria bacterium]|nr:molybdate ABC transporter permease subunit [Deltaproteobacteria bacterium]
MDFQSLYVTLKLAVVTMGVLVVLAAPIAYMLAYTRFPGKSLLEALINLPMALPPTVLGFYMIFIMGPKGIAGRFWESFTGGSMLFTFLGIAVASSLYSIPFAVQPMKAAFQKVDRRLMESAYVLGLSRAATFLRVVIPNSISGIAAAAILVFIHSMGAFGVLLMVGGSVPGETKVASIAIYEAVEMMNYREASLMSLCFIPIGYVFLLLVNKLHGDSANGSADHPSQTA